MKKNDKLPKLVINGKIDGDVEFNNCALYLFGEITGKLKMGNNSALCGPPIDIDFNPKKKTRNTAKNKRI